MTETVIDQDTTTFTQEPTEAREVAIAGRGGAPVTQTGEGEAIRSAILELARDASFDVEKLKALTEMQERAEDRQALRDFNRDMAMAQAACQAVVRSSEVKLVRDGKDLGSYNYASLDAIDEMLRPIRTKYGFSITHDRKPRAGEGGGLEVISTLRHRSGHSITASFPLALDSGPGRSNAQAYGSTDSYGRKYNAIGFFDVIRKNDDNDGISGGGQPITFDEAAEIKKLVDEAGIGDGLDADERKTVIVEWFNDMLGYALPKGYVSIRQEDSVRVRRALLSLKARHLTAIEQKVKI